MPEDDEERKRESERDRETTRTSGYALFLRR
jgi:hypothetical protein